MRKTKLFAFLLALFLAGSLFAADEATNIQNRFKNYFNDVAIKVKQENNSEAKREIINKSLIKVDNMLSKVENAPGIPEEDIKEIMKLKEDFKSKYEELNGLNGFTKIEDKEINNFADYLVQDVEQADKYVTISITTLLLLAILFILLVKPF